MINASKEFKEKLKNGANVVNYADITLSNGTELHLEPKDFLIGGCQIEDKTTDGKFGVGFVIGKTLSIMLENKDERFSAYDFYMSVITIYVAMLMDDGTIEKIRKGVYYATVPETGGDIISISAVDGMFRLDRPYEATTAYPATLQSIITDICLDCNIPVGFRQFDNYTYTVKERPGNATYRQVLSYACQVAGYNARIDNDGYMQLIWYNVSLLNWYNYNGGSFNIYSHNTLLDGGDFSNYGHGERVTGGDFSNSRPKHLFQIKSLNIHTDDVVITGVKVIGKDDTAVLFGEEGYAIVVQSNPFVNGKESEVAEYLGGRMVGMSFRPFSAQITGNPLYEPFEIVMISDRKGNVYNSVINSVSYKIGAFTQIACQAEDPVRNGSQYISPAVQAAVAEARKNAEKQISTYDKAVQNMNQLSANAMGFHTTYKDMPDGSRITYLHDKPLLKDSKTIYKQTIDGFFISTDGGKSYTAGFDKNGNVIVNILYAIGIVCDWIRGGTLTLGGLDNVNGVLQVLDAGGNVVCKITKDGLISQAGNLNETISLSESRITQTENAITEEVKRAQGQEMELAAAISIQADQIKLKVSQGNVSSEISQEAGKINIKSNRISIDSTYFKLTEDGKITASDVDLSGKIKATSGEIGGFNIDESSLRNGKTSLYDKTLGVYLGADGISVGAGKSSQAAFIASSSGQLYINSDINFGGMLNFTSSVNTGIGFENSKKISFGSNSVNLHEDVFLKNAYTDICNETGYQKLISFTQSKVSISADYAVVGSALGKIGFFGTEGSRKKTISKISSVLSATEVSNAEKINEIIDTLKSYNLIG